VLCDIDLDRDILERQRRLIGPDRPETVLTAGYLANALAELGLFREAEDLQRDSLERSRHIWGLHNPNTALAAYNLACVYALQGRSEEALSYLRQSVQSGLSARLAMHKTKI
jgi:tetratricopeptide (TPR) repeat protein